MDPQELTLNKTKVVFEPEARKSIWVNTGPRSTLFLMKNALNIRDGPSGST